MCRPVWGTSTSTFPDDAYGYDTDNPPTAFEIMDYELSAKTETEITDKIIEFRKELAREYFNTSEWDEEWWDAWNEKFYELA